MSSEPAGARARPRRLTRAAMLGECCALGLLVVLTFVPHYPLVLKGMCLANYDTVRAQIPLRYLADRALLAGHLPLWVNEIFCGFPLLAEGQAGVFDPVRLLLAHLLPTARAFSVAFLLQIALADVFLYMLARRWGMRPLVWMGTS